MTSRSRRWLAGYYPLLSLENEGKERGLCFISLYPQQHMRIPSQWEGKSSGLDNIVMLQEKCMASESQFGYIITSEVLATRVAISMKSESKDRPAQLLSTYVVHMSHLFGAFLLACSLPLVIIIIICQRSRATNAALTTSRTDAHVPCITKRPP